MLTEQCFRQPLPVVLVLLCAVSGLHGCALPGQQAYWDAKVRQMCEFDGGVKVLEQIVVSPLQAKALPKIGNFLAVVPEAQAKVEQPAFSRLKQTQLHQGNPSVVRYEQQIIRRVDERVVAVAVSYARGGGDVLPLDHATVFWCPSRQEIYERLDTVYRVEGLRE
jgi:hypothetical protein